MSISPSTVMFAIGTLVYLTIRKTFMGRLKSREKSVRKVSLVDLSLVGLVGFSQVVAPLLALTVPALGAFDYRLPPAAVWLGACLMTAGLWLFWRSHADLGTNWSVTLELDAEHRLVTEGVYKYIRHPMYASFFLMALAQAALIPNLVGGWMALVTVALLYTLRKPNEEAMLIEQFGDEYRTYMLRSGGVLPLLWKQQ